MLPDVFLRTSATSSSRFHQSSSLHFDAPILHYYLSSKISSLARPHIASRQQAIKMYPIQQLSPTHSQSSAGRSTLADDYSAPSLTNYEIHRQERQRPARKRRSPRLIVAVLGILVFITQFGASLSDVPSVRLLQEIICRRNLGLAHDSPVEEEKCRTDRVQGELNVISTGALVFGYLPGEHCFYPCTTMWRGRSHLNAHNTRHPSRSSVRYSRRPTGSQARAGALYLGYGLVSTCMDRHCLESHTVVLAYRLVFIPALTGGWRRNCCRGHGICDRGRRRARRKDVRDPGRLEAFHSACATNADCLIPEQLISSSRYVQSSWPKPSRHSLHQP